MALDSITYSDFDKQLINNTLCWLLVNSPKIIVVLVKPLVNINFRHHEKYAFPGPGIACEFPRRKMEIEIYVWIEIKSLYNFEENRDMTT